MVEGGEGFLDRLGMTVDVSARHGAWRWRDDGVGAENDDGGVGQRDGRRSTMFRRRLAWRQHGRVGPGEIAACHDSDVGNGAAGDAGR